MNTALIRSVNIVADLFKKVYENHHNLVTFDRKSQMRRLQSFK
jgi:hypothetical protein